jgi:hypothetical protein
VSYREPKEWDEDIATLGRRINALEGVNQRYNELIMAVESKEPNETRHETALRYITERETPSENCAKEQAA